MERLAQRLADSLTSTRFELEAVVTALSRRRDGRYTIRFRRGRTAIEQDFDAVVLAVPYNHLQAIEMTGERLRRAMAAHVAHYDSPGHYLRVSVLFDRPFWRRLFTGSWVMLDAFGGCCVYDESPGRDNDGYGVLGWLLAGADALRLSNADDRTLAALALDSLPDALFDEARSCAVEAKVHRWAGAVSGQPGGFRVRPAREAHQPEPVEHPGLAVVGDYLFDSTLNGVLRSASIATELILKRSPSNQPGSSRPCERELPSGLAVVLP